MDHYVHALTPRHQTLFAARSDTKPTYHPFEPSASLRSGYKPRMDKILPEERALCGDFCLLGIVFGTQKKFSLDELTPRDMSFACGEVKEAARKRKWSVYQSTSRHPAGGYEKGKCVRLSRRFSNPLQRVEQGELGRVDFLSCFFEPKKLGPVNFRKLLLLA